MGSVPRVLGKKDRALAGPVPPRGICRPITCALCTAGVLLLAATAFGEENSAHATAEELSGETVAETQSAIRSLEEPLTLTERYPFTIAVARLWIEDPEPHRSALHRLAQLPSPTAAIPTLVYLLGQTGFPYRAEVATVLGLIAHQDAAPALLHSLFDPKRNTRRASVAAIASLLRHDVLEPDVRDRAIAALGGLVSTDRSPSVRYTAYKALLESKDDEIFLTALGLAGSNTSALLRCTYMRDRARIAEVSRNESAIRDARETLRHGLDEKLPRLLRYAFPRAYYLSRHPCASVREEAARGLGQLKDVSVVARLADAVAHDPDPAFRSASVTALGQIGGDEAAVGVLAGLNDPVFEVRRVAMAALNEVGYPGAGERLADVLAGAGSHDRSSAALVMGNMQGQDTALVHALGDDSVQVRRAAEAALRDHENPESIDALVQALSNADERLRTGAARVLGRYTGRESWQRLIDVLRHGNEQETSLAAFALGLRAEEGSRGPLEVALFKARYKDPLPIIHALQDLGQPDALPSLRTFMEFPLPTRAREAAGLAVMVLEGTEGSLDSRRRGETH